MSTGQQPFHVHRDCSVGGFADGAAQVAAYAPRSLSAQAAGFVRMVVAEAAPDTHARAKALLFAAAKLARFGEQVGLELSPGVLLHPSVIERFILTGTGAVSPATRRTLRTNLRALALAVESHPQPAPATLARERAKAPYSEAEIAGYLALARAQSTRARQMRAGALVCLGAGAGIIASELRHLRGSDVMCRSGGVIVLVGGPRARSVPVLERYREPLLQSARFASERLIVGGRDPGRRNVSDALCAALSHDCSLPRLEPGRLRSTWLVACVDRVGLKAFMQAAGIRCSQRLGDLVSYLPAVEEPAVVALLGGSDERARDA
jgi:integrase